MWHCVINSLHLKLSASLHAVNAGSTGIFASCSSAIDLTDTVSYATCGWSEMPTSDLYQRVCYTSQFSLLMENVD